MELGLQVRNSINSQPSHGCDRCYGRRPRCAPRGIGVRESHRGKPNSHGNAAWKWSWKYPLIYIWYVIDIPNNISNRCSSYAIAFPTCDHLQELLESPGGKCPWMVAPCQPSENSLRPRHFWELPWQLKMLLCHSSSWRLTVKITSHY